MLAEIIKSAEILQAMRTGEGTLTSMLPLVTGKMFQSGERHATVWIPCALENTSLLCSSRLRVVVVQHGHGQIHSRFQLNFIR